MAFSIPSLLKKKEERREERTEGKKVELEPRAPGVMVAIDDYEDIFSDFDTRPFSERSLSDDFLKELSHRTLETPKGELELVLALPKALRKEKDEATIKNRLRKHFKEEIRKLEEKRVFKRRKGAVYLSIAAIALTLEALLIEQAEHISKIVFALAQAIVLPAGWFTAYTGLEKIVQPYEEDAGDYIFFRKMLAASYTFVSYEELEENARREAERLEKIAREAREKAEALLKEKEKQEKEKAEKEKAEREKKEKSEERNEAKE